MIIKIRYVVRYVDRSALGKKRRGFYTGMEIKSGWVWTISEKHIDAMGWKRDSAAREKTPKPS